MGEASTVSATDGPVTVERDVTVKPEGVIVEVSVRSTEEATVSITDDLPAAIGPDEVGFHPEHTPETGEASTERVTVETPVGPERPVTVLYGAYLDTSDLDVVWEDSTLRVEAEPVAAQEDADGGLRGYVNRFFGGDEEPSGAAGTTSADAATVDELDSFDGADDRTDDAPDGTDDAADRTETATDETDETSSDELTERLTDDDALEPAVRRVTGDETDAADDATDETDEEVHDMEDTDASTEGGEPNEIDTTEGSVAAALAAELEAGEVDPKTQDVLADELGAKLSGSQVARLDHVQKRIDNIAAYVDPLKELLDTEGRPAHVVEELREEMTDVREETAALKERTEDVEASTDRLDDTVESLEETTEVAEDERTELREELDNATAEIESVREDLDEEVDAVRETMDEELDALRETVEEELDRVEQEAREGRRDIEADVAELQSVAAQVESLREALSTAFGAEAATTEPTDSSEKAEETDEAAEEAEEPATEPAVTDASDAATDGGDDIESRLREMEAEEGPEREEPF